jgi:hypothetical protein
VEQSNWGKLGYTVGGGDESLNLVKQLTPLFKEAEWKIPETITGVSDHLDIQVVGIGVLVPDPKNTDRTKTPPPGILNLTLLEAALRDAFKVIGMDVQFINWYPTDDEMPELVIGSKPNP